MLHLEIRKIDPNGPYYGAYRVDHNPDAPENSLLFNENQWTTFDNSYFYFLAQKDIGKWVISAGLPNDPGGNGGGVSPVGILFSQNDNILGIVIALFNAAPGGYLQQLSNAVSSGQTEPKLADEIAGSSVFRDGILSGKTTKAELITELMSHFGLVADGVSNSAASIAEEYFNNRIDSNVGYGAIATEATFYLLGNPLLNNKVEKEFLPTSLLFKLKIVVADNFSASSSQTDLRELQAVLNDITLNLGTDGKDVLIGGTSGGVIEGRLDGDVIILVAQNGRDILLLNNALDSQIPGGFIRIHDVLDAVGNFSTSAADTGDDIDASNLILKDDNNNSFFDVVTNFSGGAADTDDRIDISSFKFTGTQSGLLDVSARVSIETNFTEVLDLFRDEEIAGDRGLVAFLKYFDEMSGITTTYVFADGNDDGNFTAADDLFLALVGVDDLINANFIYFPGDIGSVSQLGIDPITLTVGADTLIGSAGNDLFQAPIVQNNFQDVVNTLENIDFVDGSSGTDTLAATLSNESSAPALSNIENIDARFADTGVLDLSNATGVEQIIVQQSTTAGTVAGLGDVANLAVRNQKQDVTFTGNTATSQNLDLNTVDNFPTPTQVTVALDTGATTLNLTTNNANAIIGTLASVETLNVATRGVNEIHQGSTGATTEATITGTGSIELQDFFTALTTLDASGNSGGVTATVDGDAITVTGGSGNDDITYTEALAAIAAVALGAGDDVFTIAAASIAGATVDGGDGDDTLAVTDGAWLDADAVNVYSGFETLEIGDGTGTYDMKNLPGLTAVTIGAALAGAVDLTNAAEGTTVTVNAEASSDLDLGNDLTYALETATGTDDAVSLTLNATDRDDDATAEGQITVTSFEADDIETFDIVSNVADIDPDLANTDYTNIISALLGDSVETLNVSGNANLEITALTAAALKTIDANTLTGALTVDASAADGVEFIGGSGDDDYNGTAGGDTIAGNGGADTITLDGGFTSIDTLILNAASDSVLNADVDGHDIIANFGTAAGGGPLDVIDVGAAGFTGQQSSELANKGALAASVVDGSTLSATNFFASGGVDRGVAISTNGGNTFVFIDANKDGDFTAADDTVVQLTGVTDVTLANFAF